MKRITIVTGPTASGKTGRAVELALSKGTEVIGADSRQIYKGMPVLTAVPTAEERQGVAHHLIESLDVRCDMNAWLYTEMARDEISSVLEEHDEAVVCGGSMMYIDALTGRIDAMPDIPAEIRREVIDEYGSRGMDWLREEVLRVDAEYYEVADINNPRRLLRAVETYRATGNKLSSYRRGGENRLHYDIEWDVIMPSRDELYARINARTDKMMECGALAEAERMWPFRHYNALQTVGFREMFAYISGELSLDEAVAKIKRNTRVYAKKQELWCRHLLERADK